MRLFTTLARQWRHTFFKNAFYLMVSTAAVSVFGFVFWVVVTRTYSPDVVGLATTLISLSGLLSLLGLTGFDTALVRFLPTAANKNVYINTSFVVVAAASTLLAGLTAALLPLAIPNLNVLSGTNEWAGFVFFTAVTALTTVVNAVFLAHKKARFVFILNVVLSVTKITLPLVIVGGSAMTIFMLAGLAQLAGLIFGLIVLRRSFDFRFARFDTNVLKQVKKFSLAVYAASVLNLLPPTLLPLIIVHSLGAAESAFYYMAFTMASVLYTIAYAAMQSVFAEGSHNQNSLPFFVRKAAIIVVALLVPAALIIMIASPWLLSLFGPAYAAKASPLLQLFSLSAVAVAGYSALGVIFKVRHQLRGAIIMNLVYAGTILAASYATLPTWGLWAVGWAWLAGNVLACAAGLFFVKKRA